MFFCNLSVYYEKCSKRFRRSNCCLFNSFLVLSNSNTVIICDNDGLLSNEFCIFLDLVFTTKWHVFDIFCPFWKDWAVFIIEIKCLNTTVLFYGKYLNIILQLWCCVSQIFITSCISEHYAC